VMIIRLPSSNLFSVAVRRVGGYAQAADGQPLDQPFPDFGELDAMPNQHMAAVGEVRLEIQDLPNGIFALVSPAEHAERRRPAQGRPEIPDAVERLRFCERLFVVALAEVIEPECVLVMGVEHILAGIDHLLFVLALLLIVDGTRRLVMTITAFTVAHSITLVAATLGWLHVPGPPVEAIIALSIVFVASEVIQRLRGRDPLTARAPWIVAFSFGLLHGLGFAGALAEVGLPQVAIPVALLMFNVGVEVGQLLFVAAVVGLQALVARLVAVRGDWVTAATAYGIGAVAAFWTIERVVGFWG